MLKLIIFGPLLLTFGYFLLVTLGVRVHEAFQAWREPSNCVNANQFAIVAQFHSFLLVMQTHYCKNI